jgi:hypothetical protein
MTFRSSSHCNRRRGLGLLTVVAAFAVVNCSADSTYTLYRDSVTEGGSAMRIHVATFDAANGEDYNRENCEVAQQLFSAQEGVKTRFWCEKGRYRR